MVFSRPGLDPAGMRFYLDASIIAEAEPARTRIVAKMTAENDKGMDLAILETKVDELIDTIDKLKHENATLRNKQDTLVSERAALIEKTEHARVKVESMIARLKSLEMRA